MKKSLQYSLVLAGACLSTAGCGESTKPQPSGGAQADADAADSTDSARSEKKPVKAIMQRDARATAHLPTMRTAASASQAGSGSAKPANASAAMAKPPKTGDASGSVPAALARATTNLQARTGAVARPPRSGAMADPGPRSVPINPPREGEPDSGDAAG